MATIVLVIINKPRCCTMRAADIPKTARCTANQHVSTNRISAAAQAVSHASYHSGLWRRNYPGALPYLRQETHSEDSEVRSVFFGGRANETSLGNCAFMSMSS
eukprot:TRINITY_DN6134_c0_g1_i1.p2 TRINITY_DN6134_c0_g1~~TRINITY_DN6134_c0_g1_i1.p2  ORF type:complete len:103 (-),score=6.08 TRINITY_DN6134_c0_g1_i1:386-694(-)